ncbi:MAG: hypothetical protein HYY84_03265 [Deltaproteobacteria bacterium]|nr:hypothetical protein [Deltaproteobacteria bacterium]
MRHTRWVGLSVVVLGFAQSAGASDMYYQDFLFGERATGMGGAFTGLANDPAAAYYNPAGLAFELDQYLSGSLNFFNFDKVTMKDGMRLGTVSQTLESAPVAPFPSAGFIPAEWRGNYFAFTTVVPHLTRRSFSGSLESGAQKLNTSLSEEDTTVWIGGTYARRLGKKFAMGASILYGTRTYSRVRDDTAVTTNTNAATSGTAEIESQRIETFRTGFDVKQLVIRLGFLILPTPQLRIGLLLGIPSITISGSGSRSWRSALINIDSSPVVIGPGDTRATVISAQYKTFEKGLDAESKRPFEARLGISYAFTPRLTVAADVSIHLPTEYLRMPSATIPGSPEDPNDHEFVNNVTRNFVHNYNLGFEWYIGGRVPLRLGAFTNFSSAPEIPANPTEAYLSQIHLMGFTGSIGYTGERGSINVGFMYVAGNGYGIIYDNAALRRVEIGQRSIQIFVSGGISFLSENVKGLFIKRRKPSRDEQIKEEVPWRE